MSAPVLLFLGTSEDKNYVPKLKPLVGGATVFVKLEPISTITEILLYCKSRGITGVISTNTTLLTKLLGREQARGTAKLSEYAGSYIKRDGIEFVFISPLEQLVTVTYGTFIARRFISKLAFPENWIKVPPFSFRLITPANAEEVFTEFSSPSVLAISCDIETYKTNLTIRCIGYTAIVLEAAGTIKTISAVLPITSDFELAWMRRFNWELQAPKIFQKGRYDIAYLSRYNAVPFNYLWDTSNLFHCWYSELPKDLAFLQSFFVREAMYWKDLAETNDLQEYYRYNALDTWATACCWMAQIQEMPQWAKENYLQEFPLQFPCHLSEMTGIRRNAERLQEARTAIDVVLAAEKQSLDTMLGVKNFNANSPIQMKALLKILGCSDLDGSGEKELVKAAFRHPLNNRIITKIIGIPGSSEMEELGIRGLRKLKSTYLRTDDDITKTSKGGSKDFNGRVLYSLSPDGTDTGRLASSEHAFWCGLNIQNQPRGRIIKSTLEADTDFMFAECDLEQAESRDTAFISGDTALISAVTGTRDFHSVNTAAFFGVPYESVYDDSTRKVVNKLLRDIAKRVNHGANYNMGPQVLIDTMGLTRIYLAARLLGLNKLWTPIQIATYLLDCFHRTYPGITGMYYPSVIHTISTTQMLKGATGWTRYCFGKPDKNKRQLNAYVAHAPQSLNAMVLNKAYLKVFYEIAINPQFSKHFKLCAQIHDSILFQFRIGHEYLANMVKERMEIPITVKGCDGKVRTFTVPAALKAGKDGKGARFWSDIE